MDILITGATGFLGSYLVKNIINNHKIIALKRSFSNTLRIDDLTDNIKYYDIDIINVRKVFEENNIDIVIHTATDYGRNDNSASKIVETNLMYPLQLLELAVCFNTNTFINSDTTLHRNTNPYSLSKKQFLKWLKRFSEKIQVVNVKIELMYGPGDNKSSFVKAMVNKMIDNELEIDLTKGEQKRDFVYIDDVLRAYKVIIDKLSDINPDFNEFEIGSGNVISIKNFIELIHKLTKSKSILNFGALPYRKYETMHSSVDLTRIKELGWKPKESLKEGLLKIIEMEEIGRK